MPTVVQGEDKATYRLPKILYTTKLLYLPPKHTLAYRSPTPRWFHYHKWHLQRPYSQIRSHSETLGRHKNWRDTAQPSSPRYNHFLNLFLPRPFHFDISPEQKFFRVAFASHAVLSWGPTFLVLELHTVSLAPLLIFFLVTFEDSVNVRSQVRLLWHIGKSLQFGLIAPGFRTISLFLIMCLYISCHP